MASTYDIGDVVRCVSVFRNIAGTAVDPSTVKAWVQSPVGVETLYTYGTDAGLVKDSTGNYHLDIEPSIPGVWVYRFEGTGSNKGADETTFIVRKSAFY